MPTVLLLGGTTEAFALAERIVATGRWRVVTSLAGRTSAPRIPAGELRVGGFGGSDGLAAHLRAEPVDALVDATHPFAATMPFNAATAATTAGVPRLRLCRPAWAATEGDRWTEVADLRAAAEAVAAHAGGRVLLTTGRKELAPFATAALAGTQFVVRSVDPPSAMPISQATVILDRGPFRYEDELRLLEEQRIELLVTKNSGGTAARAKLDAARRLAIPVIMVRRPPPPEGLTVGTVEAALAWLGAQAG
jgi:precorrin-6A/cobalt-precorrin-6A reductase